MSLYLKRILTCLSFFAALGISLHASAESSKEFGDYTIHYTAFRSDTLQPEIAKAYNLTRRNNRVIINIAVIKKVAGTTGTPTSAKVEGQASNLTGQLKELDFRTRFVAPRLEEDFTGLSFSAFTMSSSFLRRARASYCFSM